MLPFCFCSCFPCSRFRLDLITHSCVPLTFWSVTLITDLHSMYVTHPFVIRRLLATSPLCLSSASWLLYIFDVKYKYSACWGDLLRPCPTPDLIWLLQSHRSSAAQLQSLTTYSSRARTDTFPLSTILGLCSIRSLLHLAVYPALTWALRELNISYTL